MNGIATTDQLKLWASHRKESHDKREAERKAKKDNEKYVVRNGQVHDKRVVSSTLAPQLIEARIALMAMAYRVLGEDYANTWAGMHLICEAACLKGQAFIEHGRRTAKEEHLQPELTPIVVPDRLRHYAHEYLLDPKGVCLKIRYGTRIRECGNGVGLYVTRFTDGSFHYKRMRVGAIGNPVGRVIYEL